MENNNIIGIAPRKSGEKSKKSQLSSTGVAILILVSDVIWFIIRRGRETPVSWWEILVLVVSGVFLLFSLLGLLFASSNNKFNAKVANEPIIAYNTDKKVFIVQSFIEMKSVEFDKESVDSISIKPETDEVTLNYTKDNKKKTLIIGYADYHLENEINEAINKYKAE